MSDKQSEALKLADVVDVFDAQSERLPLELYSDISSELRRLHAVNQELLESLQKIAGNTYDEWTNGAEAGRIARAAIRARGNT